MLRSLLYGSAAALLLFGRFFLVAGQAHNVFYIMADAQDFLLIYSLLIASIIILTAFLQVIQVKAAGIYWRAVSALLLISMLPILDLLAFIIGLKPGAPGIMRIIYPLLCLGYVPFILVIAWFFRIERIIKRLLPVFITLAALTLFSAFPRAAAHSHIKGLVKSEFKANPINIIIFDETSWEALNSDSLRGWYSNFNEFAAHSYYFLNAYSPGCSTIVSIPKTITGVDYYEFEEHNLRFNVSYEAGEVKEQFRTGGNIFEIAKNRGYNTYLIGGHIPYVDLFGEYLTYGAQYRSSPLFYYLLPWPYAKVMYVSGLKKNIFYSEYADYCAQIKEAPENSLFFTHFLIPHWPNIFDENGAGDYYWSNLIHGEKYKFEERYAAQLKYVDKKLGEIMSLLKQTGRYDESLIIVTSDHDRSNAAERERIPLYIKAPFQAEQVIVKEHSSMLWLKFLLEDFLDHQRVNPAVLFIPMTEEGNDTNLKAE